MMIHICEQTGNEIVWDGRTVWVNSGKDGSSIGRFSQFGVDVHVTATEQVETGKQCLGCSKDGSAKGWETFCALMAKHYNVTVPAESVPKHVGEVIS